MRRTLVAGAAVLLAMTACSDDDSAVSTTAATPPPTATPTTISTVPPDPRTPVLLDYSPTVSDIGALVFVASHPDLRLVAVTLPGTGESYCEPGVAHTRGVLELLGLDDVPVACGPEDPITGWNAFPTSWRVGSNEIDLPEAEPNETRSAPEVITDVVNGSEVPVAILAVGPLTNLALALQDDPSLASRMAGVTIMGGAVDVPGNVIRNDVGEWNIWVDPTAAGVVFASGAAVTLVPLDATNHLPANRVFFDALDGAASSPGSVLVRDLIASDDFWLAGGFYFWDELAAAVLADESIVDFETRTLVVDDTERENKGWTREDPSGSEVRVAVSADRRAFEQLYLDTLVGGSIELGYLEATAADLEYFAALEQITAETSAAFDALLIETAEVLGIDPASDDRFFEVLAEAVPALFAGPWLDRVAALEALTPPAGLEEAHRSWIDALRGFPAHQDQIVEAFVSGEFDEVDALFTELETSCDPIREGAEERLLAVVFDCS
jgi:inosine-uridine nucleoside N-ribohydrolase